MRPILHSLRNAFFPHHQNGKHPYIFRLEVAVAIVAIVAIIEFAPFLAITLVNTNQQLASVLPGVVTALTNEQRTAGQLIGLAPNPLLALAAQEAATDMATNGYFAHVSPDGKDPWYWLNKVGYSYQYAGENLAVDYNDSEQVVSAWMDSPTHRSNILGTNYTEIGVGMAEGIYQGAPAVFVVQFFAKPQKVAVAKLAPPTPSGVGAPTTSVGAASALTILGATIQAEQPMAPISWTTRILSSPYTYATEAILILLIIIALIYILGFIPLPFTHHVPHPKAMAIGFALILIMVGVLTLNQFVLFGKVTLPAGGQAAAVVQAPQ